MEKLLYILFCIILISCNSKTEEIKEEEVIEVQKEIDLGISDEEIYSVINTHLEREIKHYKTINKELNTNFLSFSFLIDNDFNYYGIPSLIEKDSLFTDEDREFIKLQVQKAETFDLNQKYFSDFTIVPKDTIDNLLKNSKGKPYGQTIIEKYKIINWITLPLFSKGKDLAIINYEYLCGSLCAESRTSVYKKENGEWIWIKDISYGVS